MFVNLGQGTQLLARHGVRVPLGIACQTLEQINAAALKLRSDDGDVVLKSQASQHGFLFNMSAPIFRARCTQTDSTISDVFIRFLRAVAVSVNLRMV